MEFKRETLKTCSQAAGVVVVIDVIRAFTTAAFAFGAGAKSITLVSTVEEALSLRDRIPDSLAMGEVNGIPVGEFDLGNSPSALLDADLKDYHIIQRTSSGTQGAVKSHKAVNLLASSFCCANATADYIKKLNPEVITFVNTGLDYPGHGEEDLAYSEYLELLLKGKATDPEPYLVRVRRSGTAHIFADPEQSLFPWEDIECCTDLNRFDFTMEILPIDGMLVMKPVNCNSI